jgi:hydroxypyruvate isomerase
MPGRRKGHVKMTNEDDKNGTTKEVPLEQYLRSLIGGHQEKAEQRFTSIESRITEAATNVKDALITANSLIVTASVAVDKRFDAATSATEKATLKAESVTASQIESVQAEMRIRLGALDAKLDTAVAQLQHAKGRDSGVAATGGTVAVVVALVLTGIGIIVAVLSKH